MSYDLLFRSNPAGKPINENAFREYFSNRRHYRIQNPTQAWYSNEDTGVYFVFEQSGTSAEPGTEPNDASFCLNYSRPHIFGMEAEPEVAGFVTTFNPLITDQQIGGRAEGRYSHNAFLRGWNTGNEFSYRAIPDLQDPGSRPHVLPSAEIERYWRWNFERSRRQEEAGAGVFVPRVMFLGLPSRVASFIVWGDAIPILLPEVDFVVIARDQLAPRKLFRRRMDRALVPWRGIQPIISSPRRVDGALAYHRLDFASPPSNIVSWVKALPRHGEDLSGIAVSDILDQELWST